jgi:hypothetical protein
MTLTEDDVVEVYAEDGEWYEGKRADGTRGWFPISYVEDIK